MKRNPNSTAAKFASVILTALSGAQCVTAQCAGEWVPTDGLTGISPSVGALTTWDPDGTGPNPAMLVVGGALESVRSAAVNRIATRDGTTCQSLGLGISGDVYAHGAVLARPVVSFFSQSSTKRSEI